MPNAADQDELIETSLLTSMASRWQTAQDRVVQSGFNDSIANYLGGMVRLDASGASATYSDPKSMVKEFDAKTATAKFVISSKNTDRHGDVVEPYGCKGTLSSYAKNPVVFFGHKSYGLPIGSAVNPDGSLGLSFSDNDIVSAVKFHLKTKESEDVCALVEARELRAASIGFRPLKAKFEKTKPSEDDESAPKNEVKFDPWIKYTFLLWELYEWSIVAVPANSDCVSMRLSKGFGGKPLSAPIASYLASFAGPAKVWSPGATLWGTSGDGFLNIDEVRAQSALSSPVSLTASKFEAEFFENQKKFQDDLLTSLKASVHVPLALLRDAVSELKSALVTASPAPDQPPVTAKVQEAPTEVPDPAIGALLASLKHASELIENNASAIRRITGKVD